MSASHLAVRLNIDADRLFSPKLAGVLNLGSEILTALATDHQRRSSPLTSVN
jgi:hypothetical protein